MTAQIHPPQNNKSNSNFLEEVSEKTAGVSRLDMCIQCGTCGGSCPPAADMDHTPRTLFAMIRAGMRDEVLSSNTPWMCVSCYYCTSRCPQNVLITDIMYALKGMAIKEKRYRLHCARFLPIFHWNGRELWTEFRTGPGDPSLSNAFPDALA